MKIKLLVILLALPFIGCISAPNPTPEQNTLLVGKILVNWNVTGKMSGGNAKVKAGIWIYIQNNETGKVISIPSQKDGWFLTNKLADGNYTIQKFYIEREDRNTTYKQTLNGPFYITLKDGVVNNLGSVQIDMKDGPYDIRIVDYDLIKYDFQIEFPHSKWNSYEWKDSQMSIR